MRKKTNAQLKKAIWNECKRIIRAKYGYDCYTCPKKNLIGSDCHTGHMISKGSLPLRFKFDLDLLRPQCYNCNINCGGQGAYFVKRWESEGNNFEELELKIKQDKPMGSIESWIFLNNLLEEYKQL